MQRELDFPASADAAGPAEWSEQQLADAEHEALTKAAEDFDEEPESQHPAPAQEAIPARCGTIYLPVEMTYPETIGVHFHRALSRPSGAMRTVLQHPNGEVTDPPEGAADLEPATLKSTGFHADNDGRLWARVLIGDPEEPGCHAVVSKQVTTLNPDLAMEQIMDLFDSVREFPGIRQFDNSTLLDHLEALKDIWPYLQATQTSKDPVAPCRATLRARQGCKEWTMGAGTLCAECLKSQFLS